MTTDTHFAADLRYVRQGSGADVLLIAGLGDTAEAWQAQLDGLADRYAITAYDNRGSGRSPLPADGALSIASLAEDAAALIRELDLAPVHVAGFSMGGMIAQQLALRHPELVRSLVLSGTFPWADEQLARMFHGWRWLAERAPSDRAFLELFLTWVYTPAFHDSGAVDEIVDAMLDDPHAQSLEAFQATVDALLAFDVRDRLRHISAPTLVVSGAIDPLCPRRFGDFMAREIPGAEHVVLPGAAHQPFQEDPVTYNALLDDFWSRC